MTSVFKYLTAHECCPLTLALTSRPNRYNMISPVAGIRRNRKNAVSQDLNAMVQYDKSPRGKGRPSKGGQALRSKRYYVKNHLMVLQKRRLKRYTDKVKKLLTEVEYKSEAALLKLDNYCKKALKTLVNIKRNQLLYYIDSIREDRYLTFMNEEAKEFINKIFEHEESDIPSDSILKTIEYELTAKHLQLLFTLSTLLSAYLLLHSVEKNKPEAEADIEESKMEQTKQDCLACYKVSYHHIIADHKNDSYEEEKVTEDIPEAISENDNSIVNSDDTNEKKIHIEEESKDDDDEEKDKAEETPNKCTKTKKFADFFSIKK
ncbi:MAG: hypothetical protein EXX96DRAFT_541886 [Benjaminiella poitrasii]|nr:MAG: hypothetical protein EXX96DRAFT_541886 [Benjaminiella poitrasii]